MGQRRRARDAPPPAEGFPFSDFFLFSRSEDYGRNKLGVLTNNTACVGGVYVGDGADHRLRDFF